MRVLLLLGSVDEDQLVGVERLDSDGAAIVVDELHLEHIGREHLDHGSLIAQPQTVGKVPSYHVNNIEQRDRVHCVLSLDASGNQR